MREPDTYAEIARARYNEAMAIKNAWAHRLKLAERALSHAIQNGHNPDPAHRAIRAAKIRYDDAAAEQQIAMDALPTWNERRAA